MGRWICNVCGYVYDETQGVKEDGLVYAGRWADVSKETLNPGTKWESIPKNWACPECAAEKSFFKSQDQLPKAS